jgi:hypothetical protein
MRNVVCRHCLGTVPAPDDLTDAPCPRCGQSLAPADTHITAHPAAAQAIKADAQPEYRPSSSPPAPEPPRGRYASWDDFRTNSPVVQRTLLDLATRVLPDMRNLPRERLPADLPPSADALGVPVASVEVGQDGSLGSKLVIQRMTSLVGVVCAAVLLIALIERHFAFKIAMAASLGVAVVLLGLRLVLLRIYFSLGSVRLWLFEYGVLWQDGRRVEACRFEAVEDFRVVRAGRQPRFVLVPRDGVTLTLTLRSSVVILPLAEYIEIRMASAQLLPKLERIVAGERVRFGKVVLDADGFTARLDPAPWSEIVRVMGDTGWVYVEYRGRRGWQEACAAGAVSCPMLMLSIAHILIEEAPRLPARG